MLCLGIVRNYDNKTKLFLFLSMTTANLETERQVISTHHKYVICIHSRDTTVLVPSTQEEADTRIFLHVADAVNHGYSKVIIQIVDSDVLVLAIAAVQQLAMDELWVAFASGKSFRYLPAHDMAAVLGPEKCVALPFLHAFSECDTVSSFAGYGKSTVWELRKKFDVITPG